MTEEEISKKIEFIIEQQAQFASDIQALREVQAADSALMKESYHTLTGAVTTIVGLVGKLAQAQERTDAKVAELTEAQARTDERLNVFIDVVERYISRNGKEGSEGRA
ncbi:MAG TPA: hypothetical protein VES69_03495 [Pyrinomonadaceae bacterium]|nr:hypothetical protein [Pyrinomonadaceae bacterium]